MPSPSSSLATLRPDLAGSFMEFDLAMNKAGFIAHRVLPVLEVELATNPFGRIPIEQLLQQRDTARAPGAGYSRGKWKFITDSYATEEHGAEEPVDDNQAKMYKHYFDAELIASNRAFEIVMRNAEARAAALVFDAATWTGASLTTAIANEWDDAVNATPLTDVEAAVQKVYDNSGLWPNALVINRKVFRNLRNVAQIVDRIKYSGHTDPKAGKISVEAMAEAFDLEQIIVAGGTTNTANEGQSAALAPLWSGEYAMICRIAASQDIQEPCIGRTFHWGEDGSTIGGTFDTYREEQTRSDIIRVRHQVDEKRLYTEAAHLLSNITT